MITIKRTNAADPDFLGLVKLLDAELLAMYGSDMDFYNEFNTVEEIKYILVAYDAQTPVGCGAIKQYGQKEMEVKRVFVTHGYRGRGIATQIMHGLHAWAGQLGCNSVILETGDRQHAAMYIYTKLGYKHIENYGQYANAPGSVCFQMAL